MPRKPLKKNVKLPYHVTARANNREEFHLDRARLWKILGEECLFLQVVYAVEFQAVVLMPNHFHMILTVPEHDLGIVMNELMKSVSRRANILTGRSGHVFGGSYHWSLIGSTRYFSHALKYVYRNPVRARLCDTVESYPFSTLQGLLGLAPLPFPVHMTRIGMELSLPSEYPYEQLNWLNTPFPKEAEILIQKGLRRTMFKNLIERKTRRHCEALNRLL